MTISNIQNNCLLDNIYPFLQIIYWLSLSAMDVGRKIKLLRIAKGLNQQQLADSINKTRTLISHIEVTSKVNYYTLMEIANVLGVSVSHFTTDANNVFEDAGVDYNTQIEKIESLQREVKLLNEIILNQKDVIEQLKKQIN